MPAGASPVNVENALSNLPPGEKEWGRPWYFYDRVDPAPYFRQMDPEMDVSNNDYVPKVCRDDMLEFYEPGMKAVFVYGYK